MDQLYWVFVPVIPETEFRWNAKLGEHQRLSTNYILQRRELEEKEVTCIYKPSSGRNITKSPLI